MVKTLVIYNSKYGHTKKYAQWLAEELSADICEGKKLKTDKLKDYSTIVFGSSFYAGTSKAAKLIVQFFEEIRDKKVVLFTCGFTDVSNESSIVGRNKALDKVITPEIRKKIGIFHLRGGIDYNNLSFLHKIMMKIPYSQIKKKPENERTNEDRELLAAYCQKIDFLDRKMILPIVEYCLQMNNKK